ncbi:MAG: MBOAT family protein [Leptospiraceae bacterium]|nr:MBOAT family protein [Leptospiraceae bacterium]MCK6379925.1 MBOAT family protein [Leptospiraceae bacterium]
MLFATLEYLIFFIVVFIFHWYIFPAIIQNDENRRKSVHIFLLIASYFFYMSWDYRFGALILFSTFIDYYLAILIEETNSHRQRLTYLIISLFLNLVCVLGFFKYYNFLVSSLGDFLSIFGMENFLPVLKITLPVGVSFFTFQSLSYTIDVYRKIIPSERSFIRFALFVSFFPQLVAGPIVMAKQFLPQLFNKVSLDEIPFRKSIRFFLLGYFKKVILSDNVSPICDLIFANPENYGTYALWLASFLFCVQIYCDFSGYTDMAYSSALLLGYELPENFKMPFLSKSFTEYWRRWHISLSTWLRDYVYISLGGSKRGYISHKFNIWFTMFVGGVWHGANWTFVIWGSIQGFLLLIESLLKDFRQKYIHFDYSGLRPYMDVFRILLTVFLTATFGTCFRAESLTKEWIMISKMFTFHDGGLRPYMLKTGIPAILSVIIGHYLGYLFFEKNINLKIPKFLEYASYPFIILIFLLLTPDKKIPFIYFQF